MSYVYDEALRYFEDMLESIEEQPDLDPVLSNLARGLQCMVHALQADQQRVQQNIGYLGAEIEDLKRRISSLPQAPS